MPHLRFRAVSVDTLQQISTPLLADLCALTGGKPEFVTLECVDSIQVRNGEREAGFPFVELVWFERPQEVQDAAAALITRGARRVLVTDGARDCADGSPESVIQATPPQVAVARITGAGDTFMAAHLCAERGGATRESALGAALEAAARHITGETAT